MSHTPMQAPDAEVAPPEPAQPTDPAAVEADAAAGEAHLPGRVWPIVSIVVGALLILLSPVVWYALYIASFLFLPQAQEYDITEFGNGETVQLSENQSYLLSAVAPPEVDYSQLDEQTLAALDAPSCAATGPDGDVPVLIEPIDASVPDSPPVARLTTSSAGDHSVTCDLAAAPEGTSISLSPDFASAAQVPVTPFVVAGIVLVLGIALLAGGIIWLVRANRRRRAWWASRAAVQARTHRATPAAALSQRAPRPSDDDRVVLTPENAFGHHRRSGKPASMTPAVLTIVLGAVLLLGGPIGGGLAPLISFFVMPSSSISGGSTSSGGTIEIPANNTVSLYFEEDLNTMTDVDWETYTPPAPPTCEITDPSSEPVDITTEDYEGYVESTFVSGEGGAYTFTCNGFAPEHTGVIYAYPMGSAEGGAEGIGPWEIGLMVGAAGLVLLIIGIVLAVRTSARRHDMAA